MTWGTSPEQVIAIDGTIPFAIDAGRREGLLAGLDPIGLTLRQANQIDAFERRDRERRPSVHELEDRVGGG